MRLGDTRVFSSKPLISLLVNLRFAGYSVTSLGILFNCHHSSVEYQLDRYGVSPVGPVYTLERIASDTLFHLVPPEPLWEEVEGERISRGKTYEEYMKEASFRRTLPRM